MDVLESMNKSRDESVFFPLISPIAWLAGQSCVCPRPVCAHVKPDGFPKGEPW